MGGIPWTSAACKNCKTSKVKCDLQEPYCGRCVRRGIPCPGYQGQIFVQQTFSRSNRRGFGEKQTRSAQLITRADPMRLPPAMNGSRETRAQISSSYLNSMLSVDSKEIAGMDAWYGAQSWRYLLTNFVELSGKSQMLEKAIAALSYVSLGKRNRDASVLRLGTQLYNEAIRFMANMIRRNILRDEILYTTLIFQMLEVVDCPHGLGTWIAHMEATNALLKKCYRVGSEHMLKKIIYDNQLKLTVMLSTVSATQMDKANQDFLCFTPKSLLDEIFQFYVGISSLRDEVEKCEKSDCDEGQAILTLEACLSYKRRILEWYIQKKDVIGEPLSLPACHTFQSTKLPPASHLFGTPYHFSTLDDAGIQVYYWTGLISIECVIHQILAITSPVSPSTQSQTNYSDSEYVGPEQYADEICRSLPYILQEGSDLWGVQTGMVACLAHAIQPYIHLKRQEKFNWCQYVFQLIADRGVELALGFRDSFSQMWACPAVPIPGQKIRLPLIGKINPGHERITDVTDIQNAKAI